MALQLRSQLCTFENSTNCNEILFDPHSFSEELKGLFNKYVYINGTIGSMIGMATLNDHNKKTTIRILKAIPKFWFWSCTIVLQKLLCHSIKPIRMHKISHDSDFLKEQLKAD